MPLNNYSRDKSVNQQKISNSLDKKEALKQLREFRHDVSILKKKGILSSKYDARSVIPNDYIKSQLKKYSDILTGKATTVKLSRQKQNYYKQQGYSIKNNRVIVPIKSQERVYKRGDNFSVKITNKLGGSITRIDKGLSKSNILKWQDKLPELFDELKPNERLTFRLFGNNSYATFSTAEQMIDFLERYEIYQDAINRYEGNSDIAQLFLEGIDVFRIKKNDRLPTPEIDEEKLKYRRKQAINRRRTWINNMDEQQLNRYLDRKKDAEKKRRAKLTEEEKKKYNEKGRERAKKSHINRKKK